MSEAPLPHREVLRVLSGVLLGMFLAALDQTIVTTALPTMAADLSGVEHLSWVIAVYLLTSTASTPIYGKLSDLYGRRILLQIAISIFIGGSLLCAAAQDMTQLIGARAVQGIGGGGLITLAHALIADHVSPRERGRYQGYLSGMWATASVSGPLLGGLFVDYLSWRWVFGVNLPIGIIAFILCRRALRHLTSRYAERTIDYLGAALLTCAVAALLLVTTWGGSQYAWISAPIVILAFAGIVLMALFAVQELNASEPILPPRLFRSDVFRVANGVSFLVAMVLFGSTMMLPIFLQLVIGVSAASSGIAVAPLTGGTVFGTLVAGQLMRRTGRYRRFPLIGLPIAGLGLLACATMGAATPLPLAAVYMLVTSTGIGLSLPVMLVAVQNAAESRDIGAATSAVNFFRSLGGSFGASVLWSILIIVLNRDLASAGVTAAGDSSIQFLEGGPDALARLSPELRAAVLPALVGGFHVVFIASAFLAFAAAGITLLLKEVPLRTSAAAPAAAAPARDPAGPQPTE